MKLKLKKNYYQIFLLSLLGLAFVFSNGGNILVFETYNENAPDFSDKKYIIYSRDYFQYLKIVLIGILASINFVLSIKIIKNYKAYLKKEYIYISLFFLLITVSYCISYLLSEQVSYFRKILICFSCLSFFLYFSQKSFPVKEKFIIIISNQLTILISFLFILLIFFLGNTTYSISYFFSSNANSVAFIFLILFFINYYLENNFVKKVIFCLLSLIFIYIIDSRIGIILVLSIIILDYCKNKINFKYFLSFFFIFLIIYIFILTPIIFKIFNFLGTENLILYPRNFLSMIDQTCLDRYFPSPPHPLLDKVNVLCANEIFKIARKYDIHPDLYNLLTSILYRLSYNFEVINLSKSNNFLPYFYDFTSLSRFFVTDIGISKHNADILINPHNSYHIIFLRTSFVGIFFLLLFYYSLNKKLMKKSKYIWFILLIVIITFHSIDDFLIGNHWTGSILTWIFFGIIFNKAVYD